MRYSQAWLPTSSRTRLELDGDESALHITDPPVAAGIPPSPADAIVEHLEGLSSGEFAKDLAVSGRIGEKRGRACNVPMQRFSVMGGDYPPGQSDVGKIRTIGVERGIGQFRGPAESQNGIENLSGGGRRRLPLGR